MCNVPDPPTGEEDTTMALTIQENSPMNMCIHKMVKQKCIEVEHTQIHNYLSYTMEATYIHTSIQHVHHIH